VRSLPRESALGSRISERKGTSTEKQEARCTPTPSPESPRSARTVSTAVTEMSCAPECPSCKTTVSDIYPNAEHGNAPREDRRARARALKRGADGEASRSSRGLLSSRPAHGTTESCTRSLSRRFRSLSSVILFGVSTREAPRLCYILGVSRCYFATLESPSFRKSIREELINFTRSGASREEKSRNFRHLARRRRADSRVAPQARRMLVRWAAFGV